MGKYSVSQTASGPAKEVFKNTGPGQGVYARFALNLLFCVSALIQEAGSRKRKQEEETGSYPQGRT